METPDAIPPAPPGMRTIAGFAFLPCTFDENGLCFACGTSIAEHDSITSVETMTREDAKRRYPDSKMPD